MSNIPVVKHLSVVCILVYNITPLFYQLKTGTASGNRRCGRSGSRQHVQSESGQPQSPGPEDSEAMSISQEDSDGEPEVPFDDDDDLIMDDVSIVQQIKD